MSNQNKMHCILYPKKEFNKVVLKIFTNSKTIWVDKVMVKKAASYKIYKRE